MVVIHKVIFSGPNIARNVGDMLFINFIGPEPKNLFNVMMVDIITVFLEAVLLQCRWDSSTLRIITALPLPVAETLIPVEDDPIILLNRLGQPRDGNMESNSNETVGTARLPPGVV